MKHLFCALFILISFKTAASEEVIKLAELRSKNLEKMILRYAYLLETFQEDGPLEFCEINLLGRPLLEKTLKDDQKLISALRSGSDFEIEYAITLEENMASDFFSYYSIIDRCERSGPWDSLERALALSIQNTQYLALLHSQWIASYQEQRN